jgi:hypothetical protein
MAVANRKEIEKIIYDTYDLMDPSGNNSAKYQTMFSSMNDKEFEKFMKEFLANDEEQFILDIVEFEHGLNFSCCEAAAKALGVPLMEHVYMPHLSMDKKNVIVSKEKCLVGYINLKRTQQLLHKKNGLSVSNEKVSPITGQVVGDDKNARDSDMEATLLVALGADKILQEFHGPRADDVVMKRELRQSIAEKGYVELDELTNLSLNKMTLNTVNTFILSSNLKSDLISNTYILPKLSEEMFG